MNIEELKIRLKQAGLNKKEFALLVGLTYQTVNNWGCSKNIPHWVDSWLKLYIQAKHFVELKNKVLQLGICEESESAKLALMPK